MYKAIIAIGIVVAACLIAGCGSSDEETAAAAVTKAQFIKQAEAVCSEVAKEREAAIATWEQEYPGGPTAAEENIDAGLREVIAPSMRQKARELKDLEAPAEGAAIVALMIEKLDEISAVIAEQGQDGIAEAGVPEYERAAVDYGFKVCRYP